MNVDTTSEASGVVHATTSERALRLATLCGSIKPLFSGTDDFNENLVRVLKQRGVDARTVEMQRWGLAQVPQLLRRVAAMRPDLILMQYPTDAFSAALGPHAFSAVQQQAPLVVTLHEFRAANALRRASLCMLLARAAAVITTAEIEKDALLAWYPFLKRRISVIPIAANVPGKPWQPSQRSVVVYFGQIRPDKGIEEFVACRDIVAARLPDVQFIIAGSRVPKFDGYYQSIKAQICERGIQLHEGIQSDKVAEFLRSATVALLPLPSGASLRRGSLLAAAVCGVPIVTLEGAETPPEVASALVPAKSRSHLVAQLTACLTDESERMAAHERSCRLAALVSWDTVADRYLQLLNRLSGRSNACLS